MFKLESSQRLAAFAWCYWRTTDVEEINRRRLRTREEQPRIRDLAKRQ